MKKPTPTTEGRLRRGSLAALTATALVASVGFAASAPASAAAPEVIAVDFSQSTGAFKGGASGMLYGLSDDGVPTDAIIAGARPLNLTQKAPHGAQHPNGDPLEVEDAFFDNGGEYIMTNIQDYYADWSYNGGRRPADFNTYLDIVRTVVTSIVTESAHPEKYVFTPFNEPDGGNWYGNWGTMKSAFLADWKAVYETIREIYPEAKIAGMGDTRWQPTRTREILAYAKANNVLPDMFTWHELGRGSLNSYRAHFAEYRQIEQDLGISPLPVNITEYAMRRDMSVPGNLVQWLAMFEDTKVDAQTAYWTFAGNLNDNQAKGNSANGAWWLLKWYGDLDGETVAVTPPALNSADTLQGLAAVDEDRKQATVLFGGTGNGIQLDLSGLDPAVFGTTVDIQIREAEWSGQEGEAYTPPVVVAQRAELGSTINVSVPNDDRLSAYQAVITPATAVQPVADDTWRTVIEAENTVLRDVTAFAQSPTDDWTFAASGGRDVGSTNKVTSALTWTVEVPRDGIYRFGAVAGVNGPAIGPGAHALFVDGVHTTNIDYEAGFAWNYRGRGEATIDLAAGTHELSVRMSANGTTLLPGSDVSLDRFDLTLLEGPETATYPAVLSRSGDAELDYAVGDGGAVAVSGEQAATFYPTARETGYYDLAVTYSTSAAAALGLSLNGRDISGLGADRDGSWTSIARVHLAKGVSEVRVSSSEGVSVESLTTTRAADADASTVTIEAEDATKVALGGAARLEDVAQPTNVSGRQVGWIGAGEANHITVTRPAGFEAGQYDLSVRYSNAEKNTGHAYNADIITRFLDVTEAGGDTTRGGFRHNYSWKGFWTHTMPLDLVTGDGNLQLGNASGSAPNIDWLRLSPLTVGTENTRAVTASVDATASTRMVAKKAHVTVTVTNVNADAIDIEIVSPYGSKSIANLAAGKTTSVSFNSRLVSIPAGEVIVRFQVEGDQTTHEKKVAYSAQG
ncbi:MAG: hypothetical protein WAK00_02660 [Microbacterium sp.]|uniref:hypothetical protein n=1 Tax=Microbacterium sp. TaxID=51671 RepID=UPI003BAEC347